MRKIDKIIIHCSATPYGRDVRAADIDRFHCTQGWSGIGYHYVVRLDGTIEPGRDLESQGAHCRGHNATSIGVCYIGGVDKCNNPKDTRTSEQKSALIALLKELREKYPEATIHGHREFANKDCPCFDAKNEYKDI